MKKPTAKKAAAATVQFWDLGSAETYQRTTGRWRARPQAVPAEGPRSLTRVLQILEMLGNTSESASLAEISGALGAPRSSTFALLQPMMATGYLARGQARYRLGPKAFALAAAIMGTRDDVYRLESVMSHLSDHTGLTVLHTEFLYDEGVAVHRHVLQSKRTIRYVGIVGIPRPLHTTASGRAMLAFAGLDWTARHLDSLEGKPSMRRDSRARKHLERQLEEVRRDAYASSIGDFDPRIGARAGPILGPKGTAVGSVGVAGLASEIRAEFTILAELVREAARTLSSPATLRPLRPD